MLIPFGLFVRENVNDLHLRAGRGDFFELIGKEDGLSRPAAEKNRKRKILDPIADGARHGKERRDAAAAGQRENILRVAELVVIEISLRRGSGNSIADLQLGQNAVGSKPAGIGANRHGNAPFQRVFRIGADGIRAGNLAAVQIELERKILSGTEIRKRAAVRLFEYERLCARIPMIDDLLNDERKEIGMQRFGIAVDGIFRHDLVGGSRLNRFFPGLCHVFKLEHVKRAEQTDFYVKSHYFVPPSARSLRASLAISWPQMYDAL